MPKSILISRPRSTMTQLDGLRGIAAMIVVVSHYSNESQLWGGLLGKGAGQTGVMVFFLLSGFLMAHLHLDEAFTARNVGRYALRRIARVYPLFLFAAALPPVLLALHFPGGVAMGTVSNWTLYLRQVALIDRGANVFWTIRVELLFYAVFIGIWAIHRVALRLVRGSWATTLILVVALAYLRIHHYEFQIEFFRHVHYFLFGLLSSLAWQRREQFRSAALSLIGVALLLAVPFTYPQVWLRLGHAPIPPAQILLVSWHSDWAALALLALFQLVLRDARWLHAVLSATPLRWLGKVSYSIYLLHYFVLSALLSWIPASAGNAVRFSVCLLVVLLISAASHRWLERPAQLFLLCLPACLRRLPAQEHQSAERAA